jgi:hypothetical protein
MTAPKLKPDVVFRRLNEGGVLVDLATNQIFELNDTAARIWELLNEPVETAAVASRLCGEFDIDLDLAAEQVARLVHELESEGLLK